MEMPYTTNPHIAKVMIHYAGLTTKEFSGTIEWWLNLASK